MSDNATQVIETVQKFLAKWIIRLVLKSTTIPDNYKKYKSKEAREILTLLNDEIIQLCAIKLDRIIGIILDVKTKWEKESELAESELGAYKKDYECIVLYLLCKHWLEHALSTVNNKNLFLYRLYQAYLYEYKQYESSVVDSIESSVGSNANVNLPIETWDELQAINFQHIFNDSLLSDDEYHLLEFLHKLKLLWCIYKQNVLSQSTTATSATNDKLLEAITSVENNLVLSQQATNDSSPAEPFNASSTEQHKDDDMVSVISMKSQKKGVLLQSSAFEAYGDVDEEPTTQRVASTVTANRVNNIQPPKQTMVNTALHEINTSTLLIDANASDEAKQLLNNAYSKLMQNLKEIIQEQDKPQASVTDILKSFVPSNKLLLELFGIANKGLPAVNEKAFVRFWREYGAPLASFVETTMRIKYKNNYKQEDSSSGLRYYTKDALSDIKTTFNPTSELNENNYDAWDVVLSILRQDEVKKRQSLLDAESATKRTHMKRSELLNIKDTLLSLNTLIGSNKSNINTTSSTPAQTTTQPIQVQQPQDLQQIQKTLQLHQAQLEQIKTQQQIQQLQDENMRLRAPEMYRQHFDSMIGKELEKQHLKNVISSLEREINTQQKKLQDAEKQLASLKKSLVKKQDELAASNNEQDKLRLKVEAKDKELAIKELELSAANAKYEMMHKQTSFLQKQIEHITLHTETLVQQQADAQKNVENLKQREAEISKFLQDKQVDADAVQYLANTTWDKIQAMQKQIEQQANFQAELNDLNNKHKALSDEIYQKKLIIDAINGEKVELQNLLQEEQSKNAVLQQEIVLQNKSKDDLQQKIVELSKDYKKEKEVASTLQKQLTDLRQEYEKLVVDYDTLYERFKNMSTLGKRRREEANGEPDTRESKKLKIDRAERLKITNEPNQPPDEGVFEVSLQPRTENVVETTQEKAQEEDAEMKTPDQPPGEKDVVMGEKKSRLFSFVPASKLFTITPSEKPSKRKLYDINTRLNFFASGVDNDEAMNIEPNAVLAVTNNRTINSRNYGVSVGNAILDILFTPDVVRAFKHAMDLVKRNISEATDIALFIVLGLNSYDDYKVNTDSASYAKFREIFVDFVESLWKRELYNTTSIIKTSTVPASFMQHVDVPLDKQAKAIGQTFKFRIEKLDAMLDQDSNNKFAIHIEYRGSSTGQSIATLAYAELSANARTVNQRTEEREFKHKKRKRKELIEGEQSARYKRKVDMLINLKHTRK